MKIKLTILVTILAIFSIAAMATGQTVNKGPEEITIDGGSKGEIHFPHRSHQNNLGDCKICHSIFPQKLGIIKKLKAEGKLKKKRVMNNCRGCHRRLAKQGKKAGPTSCRKCHSR